VRHEGRAEGTTGPAAGRGIRLARALVPVAFLLSLALVAAHQHADGAVPADACAVCHAGRATPLGTDGGAPSVDGPAVEDFEATSTAAAAPRADFRGAPSSRAPPSRPANV